MNKKNLLKDFEDILIRERIHYDITSLFERFLEYVLYGFDPSGIKIPVPYDAKETAVCMELMQEWLEVTQYMTNKRNWYDLLGEIYMNTVAGGGKKSMTGQFFTPMHICDFMAKVTDNGIDAKGSVMDNACGSGRMLLAAHAIHPNRYCYAKDMDRLCCLMAACNFLVHGIVGEVVCGDGLDPKDFRCGWKINENLDITGIPTSRKISKEESGIYLNHLAQSGEKVIDENLPSNMQKHQENIKIQKEKKAGKSKNKLCYVPSLFDFE